MHRPDGPSIAVLASLCSCPTAGSHTADLTKLFLILGAQCAGQVWERRVLKSRKAKHGWVGIGAQRSHGKPNGKFLASVVAPGSGAEPRIVLGGGFPTREVL